MRQHLRVTAILGLLTLALSGCTLDGGPKDEPNPGSLGAKDVLKGATLTVGSKEFTEQLLLCEITAVALESVGAEVKRTCGMSGSNTVRAALLSGDVDMYWEYTGTGWITHLKQTTPITDPKEQYEAVAKSDLDKNGIVWLPPSPANNTYAIAASAEKAKELGVTTISEYAALAKRDPEQASFCGAAEFFGREDGWPGVQKTYGFTLPRSATAELALGAIYKSIEKSDPCAFGEVFATDGRIKALGLTVLQDDKAFFTAYNPSLTVREEVAKKHPKLAPIMEAITEALDDETLRDLNAKVDVDGDTPEAVASEWLRAKKFTG
ncbi:MAG TPA: glycine betaine ABC transporter substrate-binding protein [Micromonosporaceae bacterium]